MSNFTVFVQLLYIVKFNVMPTLQSYLLYLIYRLKNLLKLKKKFESKAIAFYTTNINTINENLIKLDSNKIITIENLKLNPWFITGFTDGDGSFYIALRKDSSCKHGFSIGLEYKLVAEVNNLNLKLLESVKSYFNEIGTISKDKNTYQYVVRSKNDLKKISEHFNNYPLQTTKYIHYMLWFKVLDLIETKEHLTLKGFMDILAIKSVYPNGLSDSVKRAYPNIEPIIKPEFVNSNTKLNGHWIAGFTQADGSFGLNYTKVSGMKLGYTCLPQFRITQHERDLIVLQKIIESMECGNLINSSKTRQEWNISITSTSQLINKVIPFFQKFPIYGTKDLNFIDFIKGIDIIKNKKHLSIEGLNELKEIALKMNSSRKNN